MQIAPKTISLSIPLNIVTCNSLLVNFHPSLNYQLKRYINEPNATNINFKDFDLQITQREITENTGLSFCYNTHITKDICITYTKALWYYSTLTIFRISNEYQRSSQDVLMMCAIMKTFCKHFEKYLQEILHFIADSS